MNVYTSPFSSIDIEAAQKLLQVTWFQKSIDLDEEGVKAEISKILEYLVAYPISYIIVDSRNYPFRANETIQHWINHIYMPQIIDLGVKRYAILVKEKVKSMFESFHELEDLEDDIRVEYFTDPGEANKWISEA